jgi:hypothetical protein
MHKICRRRYLVDKRLHVENRLAVSIASVNVDFLIFVEVPACLEKHSVPH